MWERLSNRLHRLTIDPSLVVVIAQDQTNEAYHVVVRKEGKPYRDLGPWRSLLGARTVAERYQREMSRK